MLPIATSVGNRVTFGAKRASLHYLRLKLILFFLPPSQATTMPLSISRILKYPGQLSRDIATTLQSPRLKKFGEREMDLWKERLEPLEADERERGAFSRDRSRVVHSAFFRRLQGKTQVLGLGESDFYRTRLTHSLEVAQIASGISEFLESTSYNEEHKTWIPSLELIETISLAHDIGHPPFGHGGEVALNYCMHEHGGFEGNAQTLRICSSLGEYSESAGLNLTRRATLGIIKYPAPYSSAVDNTLYKPNEAPLNLDSYTPPKCIFDCDSTAFNFATQTIQEDMPLFTSVHAKENKHKKTKFKSFDTSIMELADDIAYGVHDLEDAVALRLVDERQWKADVYEKIVNLKDSKLSASMEEITTNLFSEKNKIRKKSIGLLVGYFIRSCHITSQGTFSNLLLDLKADMGACATEELEILKSFVVENVIRTAEVQTLEYKGQQMIASLFRAIQANPSRLLPKKYYLEYQSLDNNPRVICDYIAGTTDDYATRLYHKIFTPSSGSIFDRL